MKIAFINGKGGVGKSTCSLLFALALDQANKNVKVIDSDPQGTITESLERIEMAHLLNTENPHVTIIDTPPRLIDHVEKVIKEVDKIVIVSGQGMPNLSTTIDTINLIDKHGRLDDAVVLFNAVFKNTKGEAVTSDLELPAKVVSQRLYQRQEIARIHEDGFSALTNKTKAELSNVILEVL